MKKSETFRQGRHLQVLQVGESGEGAVPDPPDVVVVEQQRVERLEAAQGVRGHVADLVEAEVPEKERGAPFSLFFAHGGSGMAK